MIWRGVPEEHKEHDAHKRGETLKSTRSDHTYGKSTYTKGIQRSKSNTRIYKR
jgi:hypothetical protein